MPNPPTRRFLRTVGGVLLSSALILGPAGSATAEGVGSIDHVQPDGDQVSVLFSLPGISSSAEPDMASLQVTIDGQPVEATAELAADAGDNPVRRTAVLAIDTSESMRGERFTKAKLAAEAFLDTVTDDVYVGIVAFAGDVRTVQEPTLDRESSRRVLDTLDLSLQTRLFDGVRQAVSAAGTQGQRSILVLSDGRDTSPTALPDVTAAIEQAGVTVDVVALGRASATDSALTEMANAGQGAVLSAEDPTALEEVFAAEARALAQQMLVTLQVPETREAAEGTLAVSIVVEGDTLTDSAFVTLKDRQTSTKSEVPLGPQPLPPPKFAITTPMMFTGLGGLGVAILVLFLGLVGGLSKPHKDSVQDRIAAYTRASSARSHHSKAETAPDPGQVNTVSESALDLAERALAANKGLAASVGARLDAAGMSLKPAEWLLMHSGIALGAALFGLLISGGGLLLTMVGLLAGSTVPWLYLGFKQSRRVKAFNGQLAETLQLISGSLSAGQSLAQSIDTVVRQGEEPMKSEFKRALVEARLGVAIEDGLESVAQRMESKDFEWVVMSVRIQREVGGNLSEVLNQVAATIRERAYLRRQVKSLSAEGLLSAWILGGLPIGILVFLMMTQPGYLAPMVSSFLGWVMIGIGVVLMSVGVLWMRKLVKLEV